MGVHELSVEVLQEQHRQEVGEPSAKEVEEYISENKPNKINIGMLILFSSMAVLAFFLFQSINSNLFSMDVNLSGTVGATVSGATNNLISGATNKMLGLVVFMVPAVIVLGLISLVVGGINR